jgi:hypothetical protein
MPVYRTKYGNEIEIPAFLALLSLGNMTKITFEAYAFYK